MAGSHAASSCPNGNIETATTLKVLPAFRTLLQFDLSAATTAGDVSKATVKNFVNTLTTAGLVGVHGVDGAWAASTLKHMNPPLHRP